MAPVLVCFALAERANASALSSISCLPKAGGVAVLMKSVGGRDKIVEVGGQSVICMFADLLLSARHLNVCNRAKCLLRTVMHPKTCTVQMVVARVIGSCSSGRGPASAHILICTTHRAQAVYDYWAAKRKRWQKPIMRRLQAPTPASDTNPFNVFRCGVHFAVFSRL